MIIVRNPERMQKISQRLNQENKSIGFVPTMGALHEGHVSLIRRARKENDVVVVSIFVNPTQFGPREDYRRYPRPFREDARICRREGVDILFAPKAEEMYPAGYATYVEVEGLSEVLCGKSRPGHFRGVATVVTKLFHLVLPKLAYFGQKDAQQAIIIKRMTADLNFPVKIKVMPIVRHEDGLAMSSRNLYLTAEERKDATVLYAALKLCRKLVREGEDDSAFLIKKMRRLITRSPRARIDYISIVDPSTLQPLKKVKKGALVALAVFIGRTRLIDNMVI